MHALIRWSLRIAIRIDMNSVTVTVHDLIEPIGPHKIKRCAEARSVDFRTGFDITFLSVDQSGSCDGLVLIEF
jgi:hypothetical protein